MKPKTTGGETVATKEAVQISQRRKKIRSELAGLSDVELERKFKGLVKDAVQNMPRNRNQVMASLLVLLEPTRTQRPASSGRRR